MTNEEIEKRVAEINEKINALIDERSRLNLIQSGYIVTDGEKDEQIKKADECRVLFDTIGKDVQIDPVPIEPVEITKEATPTVEETVAILEGEK